MHYHVVSMPFVSFPYLQLFSKEQLTLCTLHATKFLEKGRKVAVALVMNKRKV